MNPDQEKISAPEQKSLSREKTRPPTKMYPGAQWENPHGSRPKVLQANNAGDGRAW